LFDLKITVSSYALQWDKTRIRKALRQAGNEVARAARGLIRQGSGKIGRNASQAVSKAGEPPISKSGGLAASLSVRSAAGGRLAVRVADKAFYALSLEAGAHGVGKRVLAPRPFLSVALDAQRAEITRRLQEAVDRGIDMKAVK
jgi:hypothetical protein